VTQPLNQVPIPSAVAKRKHKHTHILPVLAAIFPGEPELAGRPLNFPSPFLQTNKVNWNEAGNTMVQLALAAHITCWWHGSSVVTIYRRTMQPCGWTVVSFHSHLPGCVKYHLALHHKHTIISSHPSCQVKSPRCNQSAAITTTTTFSFCFRHSIPGLSGSTQVLQ